MECKWIHEIDAFKECKNNEKYMGYKIYSNGKIDSYKEKHGNKCIISNNVVKELKPFLRKKGYLAISINKKNYFVHRLVAMAFIPNPLNKPQINHIDGNKTNNDVSNLEWCTNLENHKHKCENGLNVVKRGKEHYAYGVKGSKHHNSKKVAQYDINLKLIKNHACIKEAAQELSLDKTSISKAANGHIKTCGGFIWRFI